MTTLPKAATLLVALFIPYACGGSATSNSSAPAQTEAESCGLHTTGCPATTPVALAATDLTPDSSAVTFRVSPAEYGQGTPSGCPSTFVAEIPPATLTGSELEIEAAWKPRSGNERREWRRRLQRRQSRRRGVWAHEHE